MTYGIGSGLLEPSLAGLTSRAVSASDQGVVQGGGQSIRSVANIVGPLLAGAMYAKLGHASPYWLGILMMGLAIGAVGLAARTGTAAPAESKA